MTVPEIDHTFLHSIHSSLWWALNQNFKLNDINNFYRFVQYTAELCIFIFISIPMILESIYVIKTYHLPLEISILIIAKLAKAWVKSAVTFALVSRFELNVINRDKSSISSCLVTLLFRDGFEKQLKLWKICLSN